MNDFEKRIPEDETIVEDWPEPDDYDDEDEWDDYEEEPEGPQDYEIRFKAKGLTAEEVSWISRYLFDAIEKELEIPYSKLEDLEIEED
jgi:hypothetical protein